MLRSNIAHTLPMTFVVDVARWHVHTGLYADSTISTVLDISLVERVDGQFLYGAG